MTVAPRVAVVTPTLQMGDVLEATIESVLAQDYPHIDYVVMDGGSTDGTLQLLARYGDRLRHVSGPDSGQADAINRGLRMTSGDIFAFLNAGDRYRPGAVTAAADAFRREPDAGIVYGRARFEDESGEDLGRYPVEPTDHARLARDCQICQPAAFVARSALAASGGLDESLHLVLDYDLWMRITRTRRAVMIDDELAISVMHRDSKTLSRRGEFFDEFVHIQRREYGYVSAGILVSREAWRRHGGDGFYVPYRRDVGSRTAALRAGLTLNRGRRLRFVADWAGAALFGK